MNEKIAVIGLGYVGLPLAVGLAREFDDVLGFDVNARKVAQLKASCDPTGELSGAELAASTLRVSDQHDDLRDRTFFVVAVPTPIDQAKQPDLTPVRKAAELIGAVMRPGAVVVLESTVYPGVTEDYCAPILARVSGLTRGRDFFMGYSPERINPGDRVHTLAAVIKIVAGEDAPTLARVAAVYERVAKAGIHRAPTIKVAEAAKVIENTQRDLNIALMNELALIFERLGIDTRDVLEAAGTKWNFLKFTPGLVGGHCIGVDPYYLTWKARELGYHSDVILAGRRVNDGMGAWIAQKTAKLLAHRGRAICGARIGVLGLAFKENVRDLRNSRVPDIVAELAAFGARCLVHDPCGDAAEAHEEYGLDLLNWEAFAAGGPCDALILAVPHQTYLDLPLERLLVPLRRDGVLLDVKAALDRSRLPPELVYWRL